MMKVMWVKSRGKKSKGKSFPYEEKHEDFPFPLKMKISKNIGNFLQREKVGKIPRFSREGKMYSLNRE
ncbi:MAG: hypothetical protein QM657_18345 [Lacrimispora sp.]|uniref:hypothetical protein n=1 Tax=Lacrimispora sp. TaxID=2719234 RepID=UPI0039E24FB2